MSPARALSVSCVATALAAALVSRAHATDDPLQASDGYTIARSLDFPEGAVVGGLELTPGGELITYDTATGEVRVQGANARPLAKFDPPVFGSFLVLSPDRAALVFGESTNGGIFSVPLSGTGAIPIDSIGFNYDLAFDSSGRGFVSALGLGEGNSIWLLDADPATADKEVVTALPGYSGPVAFGQDGFLYYITAASGPQSLLRVSPDQLDAGISGVPIDAADVETIISDLTGAYALKLVGERFIASDLGFATGTGAVYAIDPTQNFAVTPIATFPFPDGIVSPTFLAFAPGSRPFAAGAGSKGGKIAVAYSNFGAINAVATISPEPWFVRGSVNDDGVIDISDAIAVLAFLFSGGTAPEERDAADINADGEVDLSDAVYLLDYLFRGGPVIPPPFPDPGPR